MYPLMTCPTDLVLLISSSQVKYKVKAWDQSALSQYVEASHFCREMRPLLTGISVSFYCHTRRKSVTHTISFAPGANRTWRNMTLANLTKQKQQLILYKSIKAASLQKHVCIYYIKLLNIHSVDRIIKTSKMSADLTLSAMFVSCIASQFKTK